MSLRKRMSLLFGSMAIILLSVFVYSQNASAYYRSYWCGGPNKYGNHQNYKGGYCVGYFNGKHASGTTAANLISGGMHVGSASSLKSRIGQKLDAGGSNRDGASMIIDVMTGHSHSLRTKNDSTYKQWAALVDKYASGDYPGYGIDWTSSADCKKNSAYAGDISDPVYHRNIDQCGASSIKFYWPGGKLYIIKSCGNLTGNISLPTPVNKWGAMKATTEANKTTVTPGGNITWHHEVWNTGSVGNNKTDTISGEPFWTSGSTGPIGGSYIGNDRHVKNPDKDYSRTFNKGKSDSVTRSYSFSVPNNAQNGDKYCQYITYKPTASNNNSGGRSDADCVTVFIPRLYCSLSVSPTDPDPYTKVRYTLTANTSAAGGNTVIKFSFHDNGTVQQDNSVTVSSGNITRTFTITPPPAGFAVGNSAALATVTAGGESATCGNSTGDSYNPCHTGGDCGVIDCINGGNCTCSGGNCPPPLINPILPLPYLSAYGADVIAGTYPQADNSCGTSSSSNVISWNHDGAPSGDYAGAGGKAGVFAPGNISHFSSGLNIANLKPAGLSFANTNTSGSTYGGNFEAQPPTGCKFTTGTVTSTTIPNGYSNGAFSGKAYYAISNQDVYIGQAGIKYAGSGGWANLDAIPSFKLVVTGGNIYIDNNVAQLDGLYVAIPSGANGGHIYTCATALGTAVSKNSNSYYAACNHQLKIYGAFAAKTIHFDRTRGSVGQAKATDNHNSDQAAEQFIYSPEMWLPNGSGDGGFNITNYQGLPPVL